MINQILSLLFITILISITLFITTNEYYIPPPVVSESQTYEWNVESNPNIGFAPATRFIPPSRKDCLKWLSVQDINPDEAYTKFIECVQNISSKVWIKNLPIQSPGISSEYFYY